LETFEDPEAFVSATGGETVSWAEGEARASNDQISADQGNWWPALWWPLSTRRRLSTGIAAVYAIPWRSNLRRRDEITTPRLNLTLEQRHVIKELIKDLKIEPGRDSCPFPG